MVTALGPAALLTPGGVTAASSSGRKCKLGGTHPLYAYASAAAVQIDSGLLATRDVDRFGETRNRVRLAALDVRAEAVLEVLRDLDASLVRLSRNK